MKTFFYVIGIIATVILLLCYCTTIRLIPKPVVPVPAPIEKPVPVPKPVPVQPHITR
jgi:hypothetical protein